MPLHHSFQPRIHYGRRLAWDTKPEMDSALLSTVMAISVLTSFSKDRAFDTAVTDAFENIRFLPEPMAKLLLGVLFT